jgi:hypothetical protein
MNGALVETYSLISARVDLSHLKSGAYIARVISKSDLQSFGFIKQ